MQVNLCLLVQDSKPANTKQTNKSSVIDILHCSYFSLFNLCAENDMHFQNAAVLVSVIMLFWSCTCYLTSYLTWNISTSLHRAHNSSMVHIMWLYQIVCRPTCSFLIPPLDGSGASAMATTKACFSLCVVQFSFKENISTIKNKKKKRNCTVPSSLWPMQSHWPAAHRWVCGFGFGSISLTETHEIISTNASTSVTLDRISANDVCCWEL